MNDKPTQSWWVSLTDPKVLFMIIGSIAGGLWWISGQTQRIDLVTAQIINLRESVAEIRGTSTVMRVELENRVNLISNRTLELVSQLAELRARTDAEGRAQERFNANLVGWYRTLQENQNRSGVRPQSTLPDWTDLVPWLDRMPLDSVYEVETRSIRNTTPITATP